VTAAVTTAWPVGAHVPVAGGLAKVAVPYAERVGATAVQVFVSNPRGWALSAGDPVQDQAFVGWACTRDVPVFVHATYLINLGSPDAAITGASMASLAHAVRRGRALGARGVVFHAGSALGAERRGTAYRQLRRTLLPLLDDLDPGDPDLLVEPTAGGGFPLAAQAGDLAPYLDAVDGHPRLKVCLDTCHAFAAGHDASGPDGLAPTVDAVLAAVGPGRLALVHANDSKDPVGSRRDRHQRIGAGTIGVHPFRALFSHPAMTGVPVVVETPTERDGAGHAADIATLRALANQSGQLVAAHQNGQTWSS